MLMRALTASAISSALGVAALLIFKSYYAFLAFTYAIVIPLMTILAFGRESPTLWLRHLESCFCSTLLLGGLVYAMEYLTGLAQIPFLTAIISFLLARMILHRFLAQRKISQLLIPVTLEHRKCRIEISGLIDTGNLLHEPYTQKPVHIGSQTLMTRLGICQDDFLGFVPCHTVSSSDNLLEVYRIDCLSVTQDGKIHSFPNTVIAKAPAEFFINKEYQLILNSDCQDDDAPSS